MYLKKMQVILSYKKKKFFWKYHTCKNKRLIEVIKCNLCFKFKITRAEKYLKEEKLINLNKCTIRKIYKKIRKSI